MINKHIVTSVIVFISTAVLVLATILLVLFPSIHATPAQGGKTVLVDYELTLEEMIENGKYDEVSELIIRDCCPMTSVEHKREKSLKNHVVRVNFCLV